MTVSAALMLLIACATHSLPKTETAITPSFALPPAQTGPLYALSTQLSTKIKPEHSVFLPIPDNQEALLWRLLLADLAEESIDVQYYLWDGDESGTLLGLRLLDAADRGVRIRLLVDDVFLLSADDTVTILDSHPNIKVQVFNPWQRRGSIMQRGLEFLGDAERLNQRMHNKMLVADNRVAIVGGRNIGNAYFGLADRYNFRDLELVSVGPVVTEISDSFDLYWNDEWAIPGTAFAHPGRTLSSLETVRHQLTTRLSAADRLIQTGLSQATPWRPYLNRLKETASSGPVWVVYDDPPSSVARDEGVRKVEKLKDLDPDITKELLIASPYFIPDQAFVDELGRLTQQGVRVGVITNSLASTNHTIVNSGYRPWRRRLIEAGVELYEYRADPEDADETLAEGVQSHFIALHTKTFVIDREYTYVGSLNMDPRSFHLNTEMGLLVYDPILAEQVARIVERDMQPENAWHVDIDSEDRLVWRSTAGVGYIQPARHLGQRIADTLWGLLPIKDQL